MAQPAEENQALESEVFKAKYRKIKTIGKGSFGEAVLVRSKADGKRYIVKAIESANMTPKEKRDVQNEIRILAAVNHPNIIRYLEHFEDGSLIFIAMEYADGGDLSQRLKERKKMEKPEPFDPKLVMYWFLQICMAMKFLHDKRILHRDLKTANVFLTSKNVVKLGDFGISTVLQNTMACAKTVCGTPYYFSPELCQSKPYNNKSDVWSLGVILYEMLTLHRPFNAKSLRDLLKKILVGQYDPIPESVAPEMRQLCAALLQVNPAQRPSVNRILESQYVQNSLRAFSEELQQQTQRERKEFDDNKSTSPQADHSGPQQSSVQAPQPAQTSDKDQMAQLRGMGAGNVRAMLMQQNAQLQAQIDAQAKAGGAGPTGTPTSTDDGEPSTDELGDLLSQKEVMVKNAGGMVGVEKLGGHEDEFGDAPAVGEEMISMADGQAVPAPAVRSFLEARIGAQLLNSALNYVNELLASPSAPSNAQIQRELNALLGLQHAQHSNAITRLAVWEGKML